MSEFDPKKNHLAGESQAAQMSSVRVSKDKPTGDANADLSELSESASELCPDSPLLDPVIAPQGPTVMAQRIQLLKSRALSLAEKRERLPQPLFWSVFCGEIADLRKKKLKDRQARERWLAGIED